MNQGDSVGLFDPFRRAHEWWKQYCLEAACETVLNDWERERPDYIGKVRRWIETGDIPNDRHLRALCKVYRERLERP